MLLVLACVAILAMRVTGVHLHLCLDGQEPAQSLHWDDAGVHDDEAHASGSHSDVDLSLLDEGLVKKLPSGFDLPAMLVLAFAFLILAPIVTSLRPEQGRFRPVASIRFFQPPLRAPPL
ncbi:MAG: hypothetical protein ACRESW_07175 [Nevskiales bacterium]